MANENNKRQLIKLQCSSNYNKNSLIHLIGENNCKFEHEEADVMMISYVLRMIETKKQNIHIVSDDTDVFVLLLHYYWIYKPTTKITMQKFDGQLKDINSSANQLGENCNKILAFHALTVAIQCRFLIERAKYAR